MNKNTSGPTGFWGISRLAKSWDVSPDLVRRLITSGDLRSVTIGSRRVVPIAEIERAELLGVGARKKRGPKKVEVKSL